MTGQCFDEGIIQAFFDGELRAEMLEKVARHISDCDACAFMMSDIEAESATLTAAFEVENFELVPTERLRTKIFSEIAEYEGRTKSSWLNSIAAMFGLADGFRLTSPSVAAFASLALVVGVVAVLLTSKQEVEVARVGPINHPVNQVKPALKQNAPSSAIDQAPESPELDAPQREAESNAPAAKQAKQAAFAETQRPVFKKLGGFEAAPVTAEAQPIEEETQYIRTINTLKKSVEDRKDNSLNPSALVAYERDMAVVDNAIKQLQKEVRKNPKDEGAKQILLASYQNKIDLLSAVSEKTDLVASLR